MHAVHTAQMRPIATYVDVDCVLGTRVSCAKTAEQIWSPSGG